MLEIIIKKSKETVMIAWQTAEIHIPLKEIIEIREDEVSFKQMDHVVRIGITSGTSEKIIIRTKKITYVLFSIDKSFILNKLNS
ncbi:MULTISPECIES: hypothetical protein [Bacillus cereus group]|uniref:SunI/YnzG family protein n=1 Tax=Bacillus cereus group TaxID=86661 RepID=UPI000BF93821|nr:MULTISPECIES: hypothetical protein [Bacillus cereus group]PFI75103.1 hypothetical protein COI83_30420 [Bacillus cereus]